MPVAITEAASWITPVDKPLDGEVVTADSVAEIGEAAVNRTNYLKNQTEVDGVPVPFIRTSYDVMIALTGMPDKQVVLVAEGAGSGSPKDLWMFYLGGSSSTTHYAVNAGDASGVWYRVGGAFDVYSHYLSVPALAEDVYTPMATSSAAGTRCLCPGFGAQVAIGTVRETSTVTLTGGAAALAQTTAPISPGPSGFIKAGDEMTAHSQIQLVVTAAGAFSATIETRLELYKEATLLESIDYLDTVAGSANGWFKLNNMSFYTVPSDCTYTKSILTARIATATGTPTVDVADTRICLTVSRP